MTDKPLTVPTDLVILDVLSSGDRQTPANIAAILDKERKYMSDRLRDLEQRGYLQDAPPAERSGMYEPTDLGLIAAYHAEKYVRSYHDIFEELCQSILQEQPDDEYRPDLVILKPWQEIALNNLNQLDGLTIPSEFPRQVGAGDMTDEQVREFLYTAYFYSFAERKDGMDVYEATPLGEACYSLLSEGINEPVELAERLRQEQESSNMTAPTESR